ncbi:MAG: hypothetical protein QXR76_06510 [Candidatus Bathyarchaeia archaeon]
MNRKIYATALACVSAILILALTLSFVFAEQTVVNFTVTDSKGNPIQGVEIWGLGIPPSTGTWYKLGVTNETGQLSYSLPSNRQYTFEARYANTKDSKNVYVGTEPVNVAFQTSEIIVELKSSTGVGLSGGNVQYRGSISPGTWIKFGTTGPDGTVSKELFSGTYWFSVEYRQTYTEKQQDVGANPVVTFTTTSVTLWFSGDIQYYGYPSTGTLFTFTKPTMEMLPGDIRFVFSARGYPPAVQTITVSGTNIEKTIAYIRLLKSDGTGQPGATATWHDYGGPRYDVPGTTNDKGVLLCVMDGKHTDVLIDVTFEDATAPFKRQNPTTNSFYIFQMVRVTVELRDHAGALIPDSETVVYYWPYGKPERIFGTFSNGVVSKDLLMPSSMGFLYKIKDFHKSSQQIGPTKNTVVVFQTACIKLYFSGTVEHWQYGQPRLTYTGPIEVLPGTHFLNVYAPGYPATMYSFSLSPGQLFEKTIAYIRVLKSDGKTGQGGVTAKWWDWGGQKQDVPGTTNSQGVLLCLMDGKHTNVLIEVTYEDATAPFKQRDPTKNSFYVWTMVKVTVELRNNEGNIITDATPTVYYWPYGKPERVFGNMIAGRVSKDLLPGKFLFQIKNYNGGGQQIGPFDIPEGAPYTVVFQTGKVVDGGFGCVEYWQYGGPRMPFTDGIQLLPGTYFFKDSEGKVVSYYVYAGKTLNLKTGEYTTP